MTPMTPKAHVLLASLAAIKDGAIDMVNAQLATLDDLEAGRITLAEALPLLRSAFAFLGQSAGASHNTAAVLAEPMSIPSAPVAEPAPEADVAPLADASAEEPVSSETEQSSADPGPGLYTSRRKSDRASV